jgi:exosortase
MTPHAITEAPPKKRPVAPVEAPTAVADSTSAQETPVGGRLLLVGLMFGALAPLLWAHARHLWSLPHYQFFPFVILGAGLLARSRWKEAPRSGSDAVTAAGLVIAAWVTLTLGEAVFSPTLAVVALQLLLAAALFVLGGYAFFRALLPAWAFLWILIPLPFGLDRIVVTGMQNVASAGSSAVLDLLGVIHVLDGNIVRIVVGNSLRPLFVEEACAGISSTMTLVACSLFLILWMRRSWVRGVLLLIASVGWVLVCNIIRIVTIAFVLDRFGPNYDLSVEPKHAILGFGCFCLAVLLIWSTDRFFLFFLPRWNSEPAGAAGAAAIPTTLPVPADAPYTPDALHDPQFHLAGGGRSPRIRRANREGRREIASSGL